MNRIQQVEKTVFGTSGSTTDANRLYSILLDTRASSVSENMYDITEKLMKNEKENAKNALEQLWSLKKNLGEDQINETVDMLINFYQEKLDVLRGKEETIKKISKDSRELLEEKRKRDSEIATVKQEISECSQEVERLNKKMSELTVKEQELTLIDGQVDKELQLNANEVVNGLYEIILVSQENIDSGFSLDNELQNKTESDPAVKKETQKRKMPFLTPSKDIDTTETGVVSSDAEKEMEESKNEPVNDDTDIFENFTAVLEKNRAEIVIPFPKSVVKTTRGVVIGEYYYDGKVYKNKRHYIYNSIFFRAHLSEAASVCSHSFDQDLFNKARQIIKDANKRIAEKSSLHFEISTNEILNKKVLKELESNIEQKEFEAILTVCARLKAKIEALGNNYAELLQEQMARYSEM